MDPIQPIASQVPAVPERLPVQRAERVSRERDRPGSDPRRRRRHQPLPPSVEELPREDDDGRPHVDVRA